MAKKTRGKAKPASRKASPSARFVHTPSGGRALWSLSLALLLLIAAGAFEHILWLGMVGRELLVWLLSLACALAAFSAVRRYKVLTMLNVVSVVLAIVVLFPLFRSPRKTPMQGPLLRVAEATFETRKPAPERIASWVAQDRLDVLALVGIDDELIKTLDHVLPLKRVLVSGEPPRRRVIYARAPKSKSSHAAGHPDVRRVRVVRCDVELGVFDIPSVLALTQRKQRREAVGRLPRASRTGLSVWLGHFGSRPQSADLLQPLESAQKRDSRLGNGVLATHPAWLGPFGLSADHVLVQGWISVRERSTGEPLTKDGHQTVLATLELTNPACR